MMWLRLELIWNRIGGRGMGFEGKGFELKEVEVCLLDEGMSERFCFGSD